MISIPIRPVALRLALLLTLAGVLGWLALTVSRAAVGDSIATYVERNPNLSAAARLQGTDAAVKYAPHDPLVRWQRGGVYLTAAAEEQTEAYLQTAVADLREAARLSPADYRLWLTLGRALERNGVQSEARAAFERAAQLAPNHFETQWSLGNHLLRVGDREAAFAALREALRPRPSALSLIFGYAWDAYGGDAAAITQALASTNETRRQLAAQLAIHNRVDEALMLWRASAPHSTAETVKFIAALTQAGRFKAAAELWRSPNDASLPQPDDGSLLANGGFEQNFDPATSLPLFAWRIGSQRGVTVTLDQQAHAAGQLSLRFKFDVPENSALILATQTMPVQPNKNYCLRFVARTEALQSLSTPLISVVDAADENRLRAATAPLPNGSNDWKETVLQFATKAETEAVTVRVLRLPCAEPPCPLTGRLWLDDFKLVEWAQ
jgi:tetratricopeptide (TPR) repeat protein